MPSVTEKDKLYSPSFWSNKFSSEEVIGNHVKLITAGSEIAVKTVPCTLNIQYGDTEKQKLDIFGTDLPDDAPIYMHIHGGYWSKLSRDINRHMAVPLHKNGFKVIVVGYDLCPAVQLQDIVAEIQRAFSYCIHYAKKHRSKGLYIGGHSAGGHLVSSLFQKHFSTYPSDHQELVKEVYIISGVLDVVPLVDTVINIPVGVDLKTAAELSPLRQNFICDSEVSFKVIVAEFDPPPFKTQTQEYHQNVKKAGRTSEEVLVNGVDHFDIIADMSDEHSPIIQLIIKNK